MSTEDYDEARLLRENMAEGIARSFHSVTSARAAEHGLTPLAPWAEQAPNVQASIKAAILDLVDSRVIVPYSAYSQAVLRNTEIKRTWGKLNDLMGE